MWILSLLVFGGALAARLRHQLWQAWAVWGAISLVAFFLTGFAWTVGASIVGFLGPELWTSCRGFVSHPRVFGWIAAVLAVIFLLSNQGLIGSVLLVGIVILGYRVMLRPLFRGKR